MIAGEWLALADALAHGEYLAATILFKCERCRSPYFYIISLREEHDIQKEDFFINREYVLKCAECGAIEGDSVITVIPSWMWHPLRESVRKQQNAAEIDWL